MESALSDISKAKRALQKEKARFAAEQAAWQAAVQQQLSDRHLPSGACTPSITSSDSFQVWDSVARSACLEAHTL